APEDAEPLSDRYANACLASPAKLRSPSAIGAPDTSQPTAAPPPTDRPRPGPGVCAAAVTATPNTATRRLLCIVSSVANPSSGVLRRCTESCGGFRTFQGL